MTDKAKEGLVEIIRKTAVQTHMELGSDNLSTWKCSPGKLAETILSKMGADKDKLNKIINSSPRWSIQGKSFTLKVDYDKSMGKIEDYHEVIEPTNLAETVASKIKEIVTFEK